MHNQHLAMFEGRKQGECRAEGAIGRRWTHQLSGHYWVSEQIDTWLGDHAAAENEDLSLEHFHAVEYRRIGFGLVRSEVMTLGY